MANYVNLDISIFRKRCFVCLPSLYRNFVSPFSGHITSSVAPLTLPLPSPFLPPSLLSQPFLLLSFTHSQHVCSQCEWQTDNYFSFLHFKAYVTGSFSKIFSFFSSNFQKSELQPLNSESVILSFLINKVFVREHSWFYPQHVRSPREAILYRSCQAGTGIN